MWFSTALRLGRLGRPFRLLLASDVLMLLALMVGQVAVPWWIAHRGGARHLALYVGLLSAVSFFALPLLSPLGDRRSKRLLISLSLACLACESLAQASMAQAGIYHIEWVIAFGVVQVLGLAIILPVSSSIAAELLPPEQLTEGLDYQRSAQAVGRLMGPLIGGGVIAAAGSAAALWLSAGLLLLASAMASRIVVPLFVHTPRSPAQWLADLRAGLAAKWHIPMERGWTFVSFLVMVFFMPGIGMLVPLKVQSLSLSGAWLGACEAAMAAGLLIGSLGGSSWLAERIGRFRASVGAVFCEGLSLACLGFTHQPGLMVATLVGVGACIATVQTVGHTHRMLAMPQDFRARMSSVNMMVMQMAAVLGPGLAGLGLARFHVDQVYMAFGAALFFVGLGYLRVPGYRRFLGMPHAEAAGFYSREHPVLFVSPAARAKG